MLQKKVLIIVPAYNEEDRIKKTVEEILSTGIAAKVLVINDGSRDDTAKKAKSSGAHVISLPFNTGIGGAVQTGFRYAFENDFDIACQVDGDGQHDVSYIGALIKPILENESDMVIGSRFVPPFMGYQSSFVRKIGINFFSHLISFLCSVKITDPTSGFRAYNKKMIHIFSQSYPADFPEPEAIMIARLYGARVKEIPVEMRKRQTGHSSIRYLATLYYMIKVTFAILLNLLKGKKSNAATTYVRST